MRLMFFHVREDSTLQNQLLDAERHFIVESLHTHGSVAKSARALGMHRGHLYKRMQALRITTPTVNRAQRARVGGGDPVVEELGAIEQRLRQHEEGGTRR